MHIHKPTIPELSIVVPTCNEVTTLPVLFDSLAAQSGSDFELIIVDGGSTDGTPELVESYRDRVGFPITLVVAGAGRGRQMNIGAEQARGETLLFLHADSCFADSGAIVDGIFYFTEEVSRRKGEAIAGRFALRFMRNTSGATKAYAFYESKARLSLPGCIHGDQGFLVRRAFFDQVGRFDVTLPYLEDERFVASVVEQGEWVLLPAEIQTSGRRFEVEGLFPRQVLNALILGAEAVGLERFLFEAPDLYRRQAETDRLDLLPFFLQIKTLFREMPWRQGIRTWFLAGRYVRDNGWQLLLALDVWLGLRRNPAYRGEHTPVLDRLAPWYDRVTDNFVGRLLATAVFWVSFHGTTLVLRICKKIT